MARVWTGLLVLLAFGLLAAVASLFLVSVDVQPVVAAPSPVTSQAAASQAAAGGPAVAAPGLSASPPSPPPLPSEAGPDFPGSPPMADMPPDALRDGGPLPYRKERLLMPAEIDERIAMLEAERDAVSPDEQKKLAVMITELQEIKALNGAVNEAWRVARDGDLGRAFDLLRACAVATADADIKAFCTAQEQAIVDRYADDFRR